MGGIENVDEVLSSVQLDGRRRPEEFTPEELLRLFHVASNSRNG
jgi:hypothetical protein